MAVLATWRVFRTARRSPADARRRIARRCPPPGPSRMPALPRVIEESDKSELNARGRYVAAGQRIDRDGNVTGSPARTALDVCSPFVTFGDIASIRRRAANAVQRSRAKFNLHGQIGVHVRAASFACKE